MTHLITVEIEGTDKVALMYAHWDKQPPLDGQWREGLGSRTPVIEGELLYGRGSADDGYGTYAAVLAIKACQKMKLPHPKIVMVFEGCEESGKNDFEYYLNKLVKTKLQKIDYVFCLDSGAASKDRLWMTSSLRGIMGFNLTVKVLNDPVHSGDAGGIVPESFRICRILLDRIKSNGKMLDDLYVKIPESRLEEAKDLCAFVQGQVHQFYPLLPGVKPESEDPNELLLRRTWQPSLAVTGAEGLPSIEKAGNVLRTYTTLRLSVRIPPNVDAKKVSAKIVETLTKDPPYNAEVKVECIDASDGWNAADFTPEFKDALNKISKVQFYVTPLGYLWIELQCYWYWW
jgi:acetylornithine deacetylase/succinyl-diaminopimelate desuccinylase-like protein